jgi:uncharacterized protein YjbI with pentapeptide repeats
VLAWLLCLLCAAWAAAPVPAEGQPVTLRTAEQAAAVDDPRALYRAAEHWRAEGQLEVARLLVERALEVEELGRYLDLKGDLREALVLERLGDAAGAAALYEKAIAADPQTAILVLRIQSRHPDRDGLVAGAIADVRARVARAKAGEQVPIYTTSKGEARYLEVIPDDAVLARLAADHGKLKYCYIENLDLSAVPQAEVPPEIFLSRCVVGRVRIPDRDLGKLILRSIVLGDVEIGKTWSGEVNKSVASPGSRVQEIALRDGVFLGRVNAQDLKVGGRNALFAVAVFEGEADFRDMTVEGVADFRFSVFGGGANFKGSRLSDAAYFGHSRYLAPTTFTGMFSERDLFFDSSHFEDEARFDRCEWVRGATFENATFDGPVSFNASQMGGRLNMSRAVFRGPLTVKEMQLQGMDLIGAWIQGDASFIDVRFAGKVRFSLDDVTRSEYLEDPAPLLSMYRDYQGDKDAEVPLTLRSSYGVEHVDDLIARIDGNLSFANSVFEGFCIFERVRFGLPGRETRATFYNTQFGGETHFERTTWYSLADFTTIFANELSLNEAVFHRSLVLDDANVAGRVSLTDAVFADRADLSFYGAELASFQISHKQVDDGGEHRLFYGRCAEGAPIDEQDPRIRRVRMDAELDDEGLRALCHDRVIDEYVALKQSFGDRAMTTDEDWAYWWIKHTEMVAGFRHGGAREVAYALVAFPVFELGFGWGVRLGNLGVLALFITTVFAIAYRVLCPDSVFQYDGGNHKVRDIPWHGLFYISLQALGAFNTGWDIDEADPRLRYLNTLETYMGYIILTFFVGAYTRMILA